MQGSSSNFVAATSGPKRVAHPPKPPQRLSSGNPYNREESMCTPKQALASLLAVSAGNAAFAVHSDEWPRVTRGPQKADHCFPAPGNTLAQRCPREDR